MLRVTVGSAGCSPTPDLLTDRDMSAVHRAFTVRTVFSLFGPAVVGGLVTTSWWGWSPRSSGPGW